MEIEIFTGPNCAYCKAAKGLLDERGLAYSEMNIEEAGVFEEYRARLPRQKSLPQIFIDGEHIGNYEDLHLRLSRRSIGRTLRTVNTEPQSILDASLYITR